MSIGQRIRISFNVFMWLLIIHLLGACKEDDQSRFDISAVDSFYLLVNDTLNANVKWFPNGLVKSIENLDKNGIKNGIQLEYYSNGILKGKYYCKSGKNSGQFWKYNELGEMIYFSNYINDIQTGDTYEFNNEQSVKSHFLFENGNAIYLGYYDRGKKQLSSPLPVFRDENVRNDSIYEAIITFPFEFKGNLEIYLQDTLNFQKDYVDKYNLTLTISNFNRSWKKYEMLLEYEPAKNDSLIWTEQIYNRTIRIE